jgi:hypothetical protein
MKPWVRTYLGPVLAFIAATAISQFYPEVFNGGKDVPVNPEVPAVVDTIVAPGLPIISGYPAVFQSPEGVKQTKGQWRVFVRDAVKSDPQFQEIDHGGAGDVRSIIVLNTSDPCKVVVSVSGINADGNSARYDIPVEIVAKKPVPVPPGPGPGPGPGPAPPVPPVVIIDGPKELVIVRESSEVDPALNAVFTRLRTGAVDKYIVGRKVNLTIIDDDDEGVSAWVAAVGKENAPGIVVLDVKENKVLGVLKVTKDTSDAEVLKFIQGYGV